VISVKRVESGKIIYEDFTNSVDLVADGWQLHPSTDRFLMDLTDGTLDISHGENTAFLLREVPENAVLEMRNIYNPVEVYDFGGFVAYVSDSHRLELLEYFNEQTGTTLSYPVVRMVKKGNEYEGYGSQDNRNWDIRGSIEFADATLWGVELEGLLGETLKINTLALYKTTSLKFRALPQGGKVEVYDITDPLNPALINEASEVGFEADVSVFGYVMPLSINVKVFNELGELVASDDHTDVFGGDVYHCGNFLEVYYAGRPLDTYQNDFGYINDFYKDFKLELRNMISVEHTNVNVEIKRYLEEFGWEWVEICKDFGGLPDGSFQKVLTFDSIAADGSVFFWVRITRSSVPVAVDDYLFDFAINVW
jgi:hypothetical protein